MIQGWGQRLSRLKTRKAPARTNTDPNKIAPIVNSIVYRLTGPVADGMSEASTVMCMDWLVVFPSESRTVAVRVCSPCERSEGAIQGPELRAPSRSEVQVMAAGSVMEPSSQSKAVISA